MKLHNYIIVFFVFISTHFFGQTTFSNIDTLLSKVYHTLNLKDSSQFLALVNQPAIYKDKKIKSKGDSLEILKPYTESYRDLCESIEDMVSSSDFTITYSEYATVNKRPFDLTLKGKTILHVKLIVNDNFSLTVPFMLTANNGVYTIESPLMAMFVEN